MRNLVLFIALAISLNSYSQQYEPMLAESNEWHFTSCFNGCITDVYITHDDTLVDGLSYKILDGYHYISRTFLLREDVIEKKVYLLKITPTKNEEYLLYDFSLVVGDSIEMSNPISPFPSNGGWFILDSIPQNVIANGSSYRHFYFSPTLSNTISAAPAVWVESVGSLSLVNGPSGEPDINNAGHVSCLFKNGEIRYRQLDSISDCADQFSLGVASSEVAFCSIQSNLITNKILVKNEATKANLSVFNVNGRLVKSIYIGMGETHVPVDLPNGMYILVMMSNSGDRFSEKIVVE